MFDSQIKNIWEGDAQIYDEQIKEELSKEEQQKKAWSDVILSYAPTSGAMKILDCGTGPGYFPVILGELGHHVTGIDLTENMIKAAKENVAAAGVDAELLVMNCQETMFEDNSFDMIISRNITWTLSDPPKAYQEWKRILKPGGRMLVFDANYYLHLYDENRMQQFQTLNEKLTKKRGRGIFSHDGKRDTFENVSKDLFMSSKNRPGWDLQYLMDNGWSKVFAIPQLKKVMKTPDEIQDELSQEIDAFMPMFLIGGEK